MTRRAACSRCYRTLRTAASAWSRPRTAQLVSGAAADVPLDWSRSARMANFSCQRGTRRKPAGPQRGRAALARHGACARSARRSHTRFTASLAVHCLGLHPRFAPHPVHSQSHNPQLSSQAATCQKNVPLPTTGVSEPFLNPGLEEGAQTAPAVSSVHVAHSLPYTKAAASSMKVDVAVIPTCSQHNFTKFEIRGLRYSSKRSGSSSGISTRAPHLCCPASAMFGLAVTGGRSLCREQPRCAQVTPQPPCSHTHARARSLPRRRRAPRARRRSVCGASRRDAGPVCLAGPVTLNFRVRAFVVLVLR